MRQMNMSPMIHPREEDAEAGKHHDHEFDPKADFAQFLEKARKHTFEDESKAAIHRIEEKGGAQSNGSSREKTNRKSWKSSLFSWLKNGDKKNKLLSEISLHGARGAFTIPKPRRGGAVSGPAHVGGGSRSRKAMHYSGALLTSLFNPAAKREELADDDGIGIPYVCLSHLNSPAVPQAQSYGPVYLVT